MEFLSNLATAFIGLFQIGGEQFVGYITGIIPTLVCLITAVNALIAIIGQDKVDKLGIICSKNFLLRYTLLPILSMFFLCNPMAYTMGRFLDEKYKPAFYDAAVSFCHPITGLFPHANAGEYFVYGRTHNPRQGSWPTGNPLLYCRRYRNIDPWDYLRAIDH